MAKGAVEKDHTKINDEIIVDTSGGPPKSKKELRLERKAAKKRITEQTGTPEKKKDDKIDGGDEYLDEKEYRRLKKLRKEEIRKQDEKAMRKELQEEKKIRKRKKLNRDMNAKGGGAEKKKQKLAMEQSKKFSAAVVEENTGNSMESKKLSKKKKRDQSKEEQDTSMNAFRSVMYGTTTDASSSKVGGMTTTRLGVQYKDKVIGKGKLLRDGKPATVKYELTGGKFGAVLDSSNKFTYRPGMGEVIQGWDIGLEGMREGGRRKLIIPPKAGYGGKDIGAGPGALLYFDVTLLSCGKS